MISIPISGIFPPDLLFSPVQKRLTFYSTLYHFLINLQIKIYKQNKSSFENMKMKKAK